VARLLVAVGSGRPSSVTTTLDDTERAAAVARIWRIVEQATPAQYAAGAEWYPEARRFCQAIGQAGAYPVQRAAAIVAVLSPQLSWSLNKAGAAAIVGGRRSTVGFFKNRLKAEAIAAGGPIEPHLGRQRVKVWHFWQAILGDPASVVLDRWAVRAMLGREPTGREAGWLDRAPSYDSLAEVYTEAAGLLGIAPAVCQAIVWVVVRGEAE